MGKTAKKELPIIAKLLFSHGYFFLLHKSLDKNRFCVYDRISVSEVKHATVWLVEVLKMDEQDSGRAEMFDVPIARVPDEILAASSELHACVTAELIDRYTKLIWLKAKSMATVQVDAEDLAQEGLLGLLNAIARFDASREIKFATFADVCISNKMKTAIMKNRRNATPVEDTDITSCLNAEVELENPESIYLQKERLSELYAEMTSVLSKRELTIFQLFLSGLRYDQMAAKLQITEKSVDNAMQRVRRKLKSVWRTEQHRGC